MQVLDAHKIFITNSGDELYNFKTLSVCKKRPCFDVYYHLIYYFTHSLMEIKS